MSEDIERLAGEILAPNEDEQHMTVAGPALDNVSWQDFASVSYILDPVYLPPAETGAAPQDPRDVDEALAIEAAGADAIDLLAFKEDLRSAVLGGIKAVFDTVFADSEVTWDEESGVYRQQTPGFEIDGKDYPGSDSSFELHAILGPYMDALSPDLLADLLEVYFYVRSQEQGMSRPPHPFFRLVTTSFAPTGSGHGKYDVYRDVMSGEKPVAELRRKWLRLRDRLTKWSGFGEDTGSDESTPVGLPCGDEPAAYDFELFNPGSYNLGLNLIFRQEWRSLGNQRGEVVRTIPLGPKQVERVSTKILKRTSTKMGSEEVTSTETTTETTDTTKDSSEILREAQNNFGWELNAAGEYKILGSKVSLNSKVYADAARTARDTSTSLSESVKKTATKSRSETKVTVSVESESSFELTTASEIQNPNEEIAVTYIYSRLQRQYEVLTRLAEVLPVAMIAEPVPQPHEVGYCWTRRHDWILARSLLDASFEDALNSITNDSVAPVEDGLIERMNQIVTMTMSSLSALAAADADLSLSNIDIVEESQRGFREVLKERAERVSQNRLLEQKRERLYHHLRQNILHYWRQIWSQEDPEQKILRYRKLGIEVPLEWSFSATGVDLDDLLAGADIEGEFIGSGETVNVADLIDPAGPIGYFGNYALYYLRSEKLSDDLATVLDIVKLPYSYAPPIVDENDTPLLDGDGNPLLGESELMDPVLREFVEKYPAHELEDDVFSDDVKREMISFVPELRLLDRADLLDASDTGVFRPYYAEYLYRRLMTRRFPVDTNNLLIDIEPGTGSTLERFKLAHRSIDVLKALADKVRLDLENERRRSLLDAGRLGDPDIERVTVVTGEGVDLNVDVSEGGDES